MEGTSGGEAGQRPCLGAYRGFWIRALGRSRNWGGAADPLTLRRLSSSASAEEGILKGPPIVAMRDRGCAPKCGSRRGFLRGRKCAGGRGPSGENYSGLQLTVNKGRHPTECLVSARLQPSATYYFKTRVRRAVCVPRHARSATTPVQTPAADVSVTREARSGSPIALASPGGGVASPVRSILRSRNRATRRHLPGREHGVL